MGPRALDKSAAEPSSKRTADLKVALPRVAVLLCGLHRPQSLAFTFDEHRQLVRPRRLPRRVGNRLYQSTLPAGCRIAPWTVLLTNVVRVANLTGKATGWPFSIHRKPALRQIKYGGTMPYTPIALRTCRTNTATYYLTYWQRLPCHRREGLRSPRQPGKSISPRKSVVLRGRRAGDEGAECVPKQLLIARGRLPQMPGKLDRLQIVHDVTRPVITFREIACRSTIDEDEQPDI